MWTSRMVALGMLLAPLACAADQWALRMDGIGPLRVGMRFAQANAAVGNTLERTDPGLRASPNCEQVEVPGHDQVWLMFIDDVLVRVDDWSADGHTDTGIAVGDLPERVFAAYPRVATERNAYDERERNLTVRSPDGKLGMRFETKNGRIGGFYAGRSKPLEYIEGCL